MRSQHGRTVRDNGIARNRRDDLLQRKSQTGLHQPKPRRKPGWLPINREATCRCPGSQIQKPAKSELRPFTGLKPTLNAQKIYMRRAQFQRLMAVHQGRGYSRCGSRNRRSATCSRPNIERGWHLGTIAVLPHPISAPTLQSRRREHPDDTALARRQRVSNDVVAFFCAQ